MSGLLQVTDLSMRFGGLLAVDGVSFQVEEQEILAIIGPNGAGKTTLFNCVSGFYRPTSGSILLAGNEIAAMASHHIARRGLVRTFQNIRLFSKMTAIENLLVAQHTRLDTNLLRGLLKTPGYRHSMEQALERAAYWLNFVDLHRFANREAGTLAYGQQRRLEIARCMAANPKVLMLDEPAAGLNPRGTAELDRLLATLRDQHQVTIVLIEHDMRLVMGISDRICVLDQGRPLATGLPEEIRANPAVISAYLGEA